MADLDSTRIYGELAYTGSLTGGTGVINIGSGQVYKGVNGNVGIGTSSPTELLSVNGNVTATTFVGALTGNASTATTLQTARLLNGVSFNGSANITVPTNLGITAGTTAGPVVTSSSGTNATLPTATASASGVVTTGAQTWAGNKTFNNNVRTNSLGVGTAASGTAGEIRATNNITAFFSDKRLKENIKPISDAVKKVSSISGVTFNSNDLAETFGYSDRKSQVGVIAQEIEAILPQIVVPAPFDIAVDDDGKEYSKSGENYKTVQYEKLVPLLIEAIKEQQAQIDLLNSRIDDILK